MLLTSSGHPLAERDKVVLAEIGAKRLALPRPSICPGYLAQVEGLLERPSACPGTGERSALEHGRELRLHRPRARAGARVVR